MTTKRNAPQPIAHGGFQDFLPLTFLGAGSMARALIRGLLTAGLAVPSDIRVTNRSNRARLDDLARTYGVMTHPAKREALAGAKTVVLATKPADVVACLEESRPHLMAPNGAESHAAARGAGSSTTSRGAGSSAPARRPLVISVAAGVGTATIERLLPPGTPVVRAMPNTSCSVGESATVLCAGRWAGDGGLEVARRLFGVVGLVVDLDESQMNAITGLSGSGPAYVYLLLEAMTEAGARLGLDPGLSYRLALQTLRGAAATAQVTGETAAELRRKVTSPGGTTMAGLAVLEGAGFKQAVIDAVRRAAERAAELEPSPEAD